MTVFFLGVLVLAWVVVFIPASIRRRRELPASSAERFREGMGLLARTLPGSGRWIMVPGSTEQNGGGSGSTHRGRVRVSGFGERGEAHFGPSYQRRRIALLKLSIGMVPVSLVAALVRPELWNLHLLADAALAGYVAFLIGAKRRREESRRKVSPLRSAVTSGRAGAVTREQADVGGNRA